MSPSYWSPSTHLVPSNLFTTVKKCGFFKCKSSLFTSSCVCSFKVFPLLGNIKPQSRACPIRSLPSNQPHLALPTSHCSSHTDLLSSPGSILLSLTTEICTCYPLAPPSSLMLIIRAQLPTFQTTLLRFFYNTLGITCLLAPLSLVTFFSVIILSTIDSHTI